MRLQSVIFRRLVRHLTPELEKEAHIIQQLPFNPQLPRCNAAVRVVGVGPGRVEGVGDVKSQFSFLLLTRKHDKAHGSGRTGPDGPAGAGRGRFHYLHGSLQGLLDVHALAHDGLIQFALESQQIHVGLGLRDQLTDLLGKKAAVWD